MTRIGKIMIVNSNNTYLIDGSELPLCKDEDGLLYVIEEYEVGDPCSHYITDLVFDGVEFKVIS